MSRILALDYGFKRVGIAVTDPLKIISTVLTTVSSSEILIFLIDYTKTEKVEEIVVGYPKQMNNEDSEAFQYIKPFVEELEKKFTDIKITLFDERFTSKMASYAMVQAGFKKKDRQNKSNIDKMSAAILLQNYLELIKNKI